jgi:hypothetical protein
VLLDPTKGHCYVEPTRGGFELGGLENMYKLTSRMEDYFDPTIYGEISWHIFISCTSDFDEALENW